MGLTSDDAVTATLGALPGLAITVFGDFSLDAYWDIRSDTTQMSVETGLPVHEVGSQRYSLGGAGNVAANLRAMGVGQVRVVGVCGRDPFGTRLLEEFDELKVDHSAMRVLEEPWETLVYAKPYVGAAEQSRLDFGTCDDLPEAIVEELLGALGEAAAHSDAVIVNQQIRTGLFSARVKDRVQELIAAHPDVVFVVDTRHVGTAFRGAVLKLNTREATALVGDPVREDLPDEEAYELAARISTMTGRSAFVTRGELGLLVADGPRVHHVLPVDVGPRVDTVGAGDSVTAAVAAMLAAGGTAQAAGEVANLAASVSVRRLQSTGAEAVTASAIAAARGLDVVYAPALADNPTRARHVQDTEIELVDPSAVHRTACFTHAIFDHDGTLSTLREGWESVMAPMMLEAILGPAYGKTSAVVVMELQERIAEFIDRTTGIQTLVQMQGLVDLVREAGFVPESEILDHHGYKATYNELLLEQVQRRIAQLRAGQLSREDFHIKNAVPLLSALRDAGLTLHLASGTDEADVVAEANELGFGEFFEDRIYGSIGSVTHEAKRVVIERIIAQNQLHGSEILTFGDGPVEMRETRKRGGLAVGVCSDEVRRYGFNQAKRRRLIRGGAQLLIPDYSDLGTLLDVIGIRDGRQR